MNPGTPLFFKFKIILIFLFILCHSVAEGQNLHTYVDRDSVRVGDILTFTLVLDGTYSSVQFPTEEDFESEFEFLSRERFQTTQQLDSLVYRLQFFGSESVTLGRKPVQLSEAGRDTVLFSTPVPLSFRTVLDEDESEFRPIKPIFEFARNLWPLLLLILLLAGIAAYFYKRYLLNPPLKSELPTYEPIPFPDPIRELTQALSHLKGKRSPQTFEEFELFYIELGDIIRLYLKRVYQFPALEMTTREIIEALRADLAHEEFIAITRKMLQEADMVKFANFHPQEELAISALKKAEQFLQTVSVTDHERVSYMRYKHEQQEEERKREVAK